jgi:hypothetical protein
MTQSRYGIVSSGKLRTLRMQKRFPGGQFKDEDIQKIPSKPSIG